MSRAKLFSVVITIANLGFVIFPQVSLAIPAVPAPPARLSTVQKLHFQRENTHLAIEVLADKIVHFEFSSSPSRGNKSIYLTPYVDRERFNFSGPAKFIRGAHSFETAALKIDIDPNSLCLSAHDKQKNKKLTRVCPLDLKSDLKVLSISREQMTDVYGLGEMFLPHRAGQADGNWINEYRKPADVHGNFMEPFRGGYVENSQFPIMYAVAPAKLNYALFLDQVYKQNWDFRGDTWKVEMWGDQVRFFLLAGDDLPELRSSYMKLVGRPLVPPKKAFGLWVSEYGFDNWQELRDKLRTLRKHRFPIDGFVLDLQWFGGVKQSETSPMGTLRFDEKNFPQPEKVIRELREKEGLGLMTIEESYVSRGLPEHRKLEEQGFLARERADSNKAFFINNEVPWWGLGGMIDWSNPETGKFWHDWKRQPLIDLGIMGHWTDLGEPEMYTDKDRPGALPYYYGFPELGKNREADVHNVFSLLWHESIFKGYQRHQVTQRPWILSRAGGPGVQRYGVGMWSGDIGSNFSSLATHFNVQMHMSFSGVDYFGADISGFHRGAMAEEPGIDLNELYTQWFANGAAFDVPVRPHTENVNNTRETAPDRLGDLKSNLANIRLRYELSPYYYSLAHRAHLYSEPVVPPLVYYYQDAPSDRADFNVRKIGHEKLIGRDLLFAVVARSGEKERDIYLPPGEWVDYRTNRRHKSSGTSLRSYPVYVDGAFRLPLFVRGGAIIPKMFVDEQTMNIEGLRLDGSIRNELIARVYAGQDSVNYDFTLFEDDGRTTEYLAGRLAQTTIRQMKVGSRVEVKVESTRGTYNGAPQTRQTVIELVGLENVANTTFTVKLNGSSLKHLQTRAQFETAASGWYFDSASKTLHAKSDLISVLQTKIFEFLAVE